MDPKARAGEIQELIREIEALPDDKAKSLVHRCLRCMLELYGDGLARILDIARNGGEAGRRVMDSMLHDGLVRSLLLIHNLHPQSLEERVREALEKVRPYLKSHGGNVELISLAGDVANLRLQGTCKSCPSSSATLELAVTQSLEETCPDLGGIEVEGVATTAASPVPRGGNGGNHAPQWKIIDGFNPVGAGEMRLVQVDGAPVLICCVRDNLYAYRNRCAACGEPLDSGNLNDGLLSCGAGHRFDVRQAGASLDDQQMHLDPIPLLAANGVVKICVK